MVKNFTIHNRKGRTDLKEFEKDLISFGLLRFKKSLKVDTTTSLDNFVLDIIRLYNRASSTYYVKNNGTQIQSYRNRSAGDIFRICKYYYPKCTLTQVLRILYNTNKTNRKEDISSSICNEIHKRVYYPTSSGYGEFHSDYIIDEFGKLLENYEK